MNGDYEVLKKSEYSESKLQMWFIYKLIRKIPLLKNWRKESPTAIKENLIIWRSDFDYFYVKVQSKWVWTVKNVTSKK